MKFTDQTLLDQMQLNELQIQRRKELLDLNDEDIKFLVSCQPFIHSRIDAIVDEFYKRQTAIDEIALLIGDADTLQRLRHVQRTYTLDLFGGYYDLEYVNNRLRIGMVHKRIGVEPKLYLTAVKTLRDLLAAEIAANVPDAVAQFRTLQALDKLLYFDIALIFDTYIRSLLTEIETAKEKTESYARSLEERILERTRQLEALSSTDALTGLYNKRVLYEALRRDIKYVERMAKPLTLVYFDVDGFKEINDRLGHHRGDDILRAIGACLRSVSRAVDVPCRYGGDEFCIVLPDTTREQAREYCDRFIQQFTRQEPEITASIGIAQTGPDRYVTPEELIVQADRLMYRAKEVPGFQIAVESASGGFKLQGLEIPSPDSKFPSGRIAS